MRELAVTNAVQSARQALNAADDLSPPGHASREGLDWRSLVRQLNAPMDVSSDHLVAAGGAVLFLIAGAACGAWMQVV